MAAASTTPSRLAQDICEGVTPFPYKKEFLKPPETYFGNLQKFAYVEVSTEAYIAKLRKGGKTRSTLAQTPWGFDQEEISFIVAEEAYEDVDQITDHFTEVARMQARVRGSAAPVDEWRRPGIAEMIAKEAFALARKDRSPMTPHHLREACYKFVPECTLFKVSLAVEICRFFGAKTVLDPFAGWGDRMLGAAGAAVAKYVGVDPNPALELGHGQIAEFIGRNCPNTEASVRPIPFEEYGPEELEADFGSRGADFVFSSPPFFDYEIYSDDPRQSTRHNTLEKWLDDWFLPVTDRAWGALAPGGCLAYYISDGRGEVTKPLCKHMSARKRKFRGVIACRRGSKRPLPLWVWVKGDDEEVAVPDGENATAAAGDIFAGASIHYHIQGSPLSPDDSGPMDIYFAMNPGGEGKKDE